MDEHANTLNTAPVNTPSAEQAVVRNKRGDYLRYVPPVAALGTAFVLQLILVTDTVGTALANMQPGPAWNWAWYLFAGILGLAVASCVEGGAAYLMDLYDKHLLARDSVWVLRLGMLAYVGGSAGAVHWWLADNGMPREIAWILGGMSASALFLWSRGSRWQHRAEMRAAGQLDPALPRLSTAAKVLHPVRWLITLYLVSWRPVRTTDEARERYEQWRSGRHWWSRSVKTSAPTNTSAPVVAANGDRTTSNSVPISVPDSDDHTVVSINGAGRRKRANTSTAVKTNTGVRPTVEQMADTLRREHGPRSIGRPSAEQILRRVYGTCASADAKTAKDIHNARLEQGDNDDTEQEESRDRELVAAGA